ncbi:MULTISPECIES: transglycosylase SLT domain-containing protein [Acidiphilium]|nr:MULTISPECIES: transglycosylase SLT domain-containing protein [Acidiphilium]
MLLIGVATAQNVAPMPQAPAEVVPVFQFPGIPAFSPGPGSAPLPTGTGGGGTATGSGGGSGSSSSNVMAELMATPYGQAALAAAQADGLNPTTMAALAQVESHFQNIADTGGSTSAFGPWQVESGTWQTTCRQYGLPYTLADMSNPQDEAVVAADTMVTYANSVAAATGSPPTIDQMYGAYIFGPGVGGPLATVQNMNEPLSQVVPAVDISNNNLQGMTVGDFYNVMNQRMGGVGGQPVFNG